MLAFKAVATVTIVDRDGNTLIHIVVGDSLKVIKKQVDGLGILTTESEAYNDAQIVHALVSYLLK